MQTSTPDITKLKEGNIKYFEQLFKEYYPLLCRYALRIVKEHEQAEEIVQDLFVKLWQKREDLDVHTSLNAYLYRATYLNCLSHLRNLDTRLKYEEEVRFTTDAQVADEIGDTPEMQKIIEYTLESLPVRGRQIFEMSRFEGLKYSEIADKLSISVKTVEANMGKALKLFRNNLRDFIGTLTY